MYRMENKRSQPLKSVRDDVGEGGITPVEKRKREIERNPNFEELAVEEESLMADFKNVCAIKDRIKSSKESYKIDSIIFDEAMQKVFIDGLFPNGKRVSVADPITGVSEIVLVEGFSYDADQDIFTLDIQGEDYPIDIDDPEEYFQAGFDLIVFERYVQLYNLYQVDNGFIELIDKGNPDMDVAGWIDRGMKHMRHFDPRTGEEYEETRAKKKNGKLTPAEQKMRDEAHERLRNDVEYAREILKKQYYLLRDIAKGAYQYLERFPDAGFLELKDTFFPEHIEDQLSPQQASQVERGLYQLAKHKGIIEKHWQKYAGQNPARVAERVIGLESNSIQGEVTMQKRLGSLNFNFTQDDDYDLACREKGEHKLSYGITLSDITGEPELSGMVSVSRHDDNFQLRSTLVHEEAHLLLNFVMGEYIFNYTGFPIHRLMEEIIAKYREEREVPYVVNKEGERVDNSVYDEDLIEDLQEEGGAYDYYEKEREEVVGDDTKAAEVQAKWDTHKKRVERLVDVASRILDNDLHVDVELLAVAPPQHWKWMIND